MISFSWSNNEDGTYTFSLKTDAVQVGTLHRITAAIYTLNLDIVSGDVTTVNNGAGSLSEDSFVVKPAPLLNGTIGPNIPGQLGVLMEMLLARSETTEELLKRYGTLPPEPFRYFDLRPEIVVQHHLDNGLTEFYIEAPDRRGFLFNLTRILAGYGIDIERAQIRTSPDGLAQDLFYISLNGERIDPSLMSKIEEMIYTGQ